MNANRQRQETFDAITGGWTGPRGGKTPRRRPRNQTTASLATFPAYQRRQERQKKAFKDADRFWEDFVFQSKMTSIERLVRTDRIPRCKNWTMRYRPRKPCWIGHDSSGNSYELMIPWVNSGLFTNAFLERCEGKNKDKKIPIPNKVKTTIRERARNYFESQIVYIMHHRSTTRKGRTGKTTGVKTWWVGWDHKNNSHNLTEEWMQDNFVHRVNEKAWLDRQRTIFDRKVKVPESAPRKRLMTIYPIVWVDFGKSKHAAQLVDTEMTLSGDLCLVKWCTTGLTEVVDRQQVSFSLGDRPKKRVRRESDWFLSIEGAPLVQVQQKEREPTCLFASLSSALYVSGDKYAGDYIKEKIPLSIVGTCEDRMAFAIECMRGRPLLYDPVKIKNFNVLEDRSSHPTVCKILDSKGGSNHAVTVWNDWIIDSNHTHAIPLCIEALNWCCGEDVDVWFVKVVFAVRCVRICKKKNVRLLLLLTN